MQAPVSNRPNIQPRLAIAANDSIGELVIHFCFTFFVA
jgi:hypothetical protein